VVQVLNCYIQPGEQQELKDRAKKIVDVAKDIIKLLKIPPKAEADATHLALAILHRMTYLLTWNCTHLANPTLQKELIEYCNYHQLHIPVICTPELLLPASP
jgi:hypothetical protein